MPRTCWLRPRTGPSRRSRSCWRDASRARGRWGWCRPRRAHPDPRMGDPPRGGYPSANPRHIPAQVKRAVWARDGGQCTFVSEAGHRCAARKLLEFDHVEEVARGGKASVAGIRLRCRAHNQHGAECTFGAGFMRQKLEATQRAAAARRGEAAARAADEAQRKAAEAQARAAAEEVIAPLRSLGFNA